MIAYGPFGDDELALAMFLLLPVSLMTGRLLVWLARKAERDE